MSVIDEVLAANGEYAEGFQLGSLATAPTRKLAIVACMDARMTIEPMLGLKTGEAHILRNAGGIVTADTLRSPVISHHLLGTTEFMVINHTDCGMLTFKDDDLRERLQESTGTAVVEPAAFLAFRDVEENVRRQVWKLRDHPWLPPTISVRGFVYHVETGKLHEVSATRSRAA